MKKQVEDFIDMLRYKFGVEVDSFPRPYEEEPAYQVRLKTQVPNRTFGDDLRAADWAFIASAAAYNDVDFNVALIESEGLWINVITK